MCMVFVLTWMYFGLVYWLAGRDVSRNDNGAEEMVKKFLQNRRSKKLRGYDGENNERASYKMRSLWEFLNSDRRPIFQKTLKSKTLTAWNTNTTNFFLGIYLLTYLPDDAATGCEWQCQWQSQWQSQCQDASCPVPSSERRGPGQTFLVTQPVTNLSSLQEKELRLEFTYFHLKPQVTHVYAFTLFFVLHDVYAEPQDAPDHRILQKKQQ